MLRIASVVLRRRRVVLFLWLVVAATGLATLSTTIGRLSPDLTIPGQPSFVADARIDALYGSGGNALPVIVVATAPFGTSSAAANSIADQIFQAARSSMRGSRLADLTNTGDIHLVGDRGLTQWAVIFTRPSRSFSPPNPAPAIRTATERVAPLGWRVGITGGNLLQAGSAHHGTSTLTETLAGALGALLVLAVVFASFIAVIPLLMAAVAIPTTFLAVLGLSNLMTVSVIAQFLIALIGLGIAIDYSLLVITRWRELRAQGEENEIAVEHAMVSAGRAVVFSGLTVALSLLSLVVLPVPFLRSIGISGFLIPLVSVAVAVTLLPVLLATVGPRLDRPRLRNEVGASRPWRAWARFILRHRRAAALGAGVVLIGVVLPFGGLRLGEPVAASLSQGGPAFSTLHQLQSLGVPSGVLDPTEILVESVAAEHVARRFNSQPGVFMAVAPTGGDWHRSGTSIVDVFPVAEPSAALGASETAHIVAEASGIPGVLGVGGAGPSQSDFITAVYGHFPLMLALVALATLLLLTRAFRSIVLAAKAVLLNLTSVAAAYGVMVLVWQDGFGSRLIWSTPATGSITVWVPLMVFAFLFGLSMDYEVFILSRVREEYDITGSTDTAIELGIARTGRLVTSAALILCLGFVAMASAPATDLRIMATGLGAGILLDALLIRSVLVPALLGVLGGWNWWLPPSLARLLRIKRSPSEAVPGRSVA